MSEHMYPEYWEEAIRYLSADPIISPLISRYPDSRLVSRGDPFHTLMRSIVGQQVSVAAADAIWNRMSALCAAHASPIVPETFLLMPDEALRAVGLSRQKVNYIRHLSEFFMAEHIQSVAFWQEMTDKEVIKHITQVKGIGTWSAEMFLIFCLLRQDIWPLADIGLQRALMIHCLPFQKPFPYEQAVELSRQWQPYRTVALWYLWRSIDPNEVHY